MLALSKQLCAKSHIIASTINVGVSTTSRSHKLLSDIKALSKVKLSLWVTATGASSYLMTLPLISVDLLNTCSGIFFCSTAAHAFNQIIEKEQDATMKRTRNRPLPSSSMTTRQAAFVGACSGMLGTSLLYMGGGLYAPLLALFNIGFYTLAYTPLKRKSQWNTHVGSLVGSIPPIIGSVAAGADLLSPEPLLLFGLMYVWQIPHFYSLAWLHREDYLNANFKMYGIEDTSGEVTAAASVRWISFLTALPMIYNLLGYAPPELILATFLPNLFVLHKATKYWIDPNKKNVIILFKHSLWISLPYGFEIAPQERIEGIWKRGTQSSPVYTIPHYFLMI